MGKCPFFVSFFAKDIQWGPRFFYTHYICLNGQWSQWSQNYDWSTVSAFDILKVNPTFWTALCVVQCSQCPPNRWVQSAFISPLPQMVASSTSPFSNRPLFSLPLLQLRWVQTEHFCLKNRGRKICHPRTQNDLGGSRNVSSNILGNIRNSW